MLAAPARAVALHRTDAIQIAPLVDEALIASTLRHPRIFPHISDDSCPEAGGLKVQLVDALLFLGAYRGEQFLGLFLIHQHNFVLFEGHTCLLPLAWGQSTDAAKACIAWLFENTSCRRLVTSVPDGNDLALRLAKRAGMTEYGRNPRSIQRGGRQLDQVLLGISKD
jgi:RimJ/RimL family protein N-acetyltransferase